MISYLHIFTGNHILIAFYVIKFSKSRLRSYRFWLHNQLFILLKFAFRSIQLLNKQKFIRSIFPNLVQLSTTKLTTADSNFQTLSISYCRESSTTACMLRPSELAEAPLTLAIVFFYKHSLQSWQLLECLRCWFYCNAFFNHRFFASNLRRIKI